MALFLLYKKLSTAADFGPAEKFLHLESAEAMAKIYRLSGMIVSIVAA